MKGCQKKIILLKGTESALFEEAYFIIKETEIPSCKNDMIAEACRIIEANDLSAAPKSVKLSRKKKLAYFLYGALFASLTEIAVYILLHTGR